MHIPVRSEPEMFWAMVLTVLGAVLVGVVGAVSSGGWWAILAGVLIGVGLVALWLRAQGSEPETVEVAGGGDAAYRVLVVANETVEGEALLTEIRNRTSGRRRAELLVVCPATDASRLQHIASDTDAAREEAERRLRRSLAALERAGLKAEGIVGDEDPTVAATDALRSFGAREVIISTHPPERSRWLERGVVEQLRAEVPLPITHVVVDRVAERAPAA